MALIYWLSSQPGLPAPPASLGDKGAHALVYGALAALWFRALAAGRLEGLTPPRAARAVLWSALYGLTDELHQSLVPTRTSEIADIFADVGGASAAVLLVWAWGILYARRLARHADVSR